MNLKSVYEIFPTQSDCIKHLEKILWNNKPRCPYCEVVSDFNVKYGDRYKCGTCKTSFSVTVQTMFHKTKCDLQKWFLAILYVLAENRQVSSRQLANKIEVTKDTAWFMISRIKKALEEDINSNNIQKIIQQLKIKP